MCEGVVARESKTSSALRNVWRKSVLSYWAGSSGGPNVANPPLSVQKAPKGSAAPISPSSSEGAAGAPGVEQLLNTAAPNTRMVVRVESLEAVTRDIEGNYIGFAGDR